MLFANSTIFIYGTLWMIRATGKCVTIHRVITILHIRQYIPHMPKSINTISAVNIQTLYRCSIYKELHTVHRDELKTAECQAESTVP